MKWNEPKQNETKRNEMKRNETKQNKTKTVFDPRWNRFPPKIYITHPFTHAHYAGWRVGQQRGPSSSGGPFTKVYKTGGKIIFYPSKDGGQTVISL